MKLPEKLPEGEEMLEGEVVSLKKADEVAGGKSFGFIKRTGEGVDKGEKDIFFSEMYLAPGTSVDDLVSTTNENVRVQFSISDAGKGPMATDVKVIPKKSKN